MGPAPSPPRHQRCSLMDGKPSREEATVSGVRRFFHSVSRCQLVIVGPTSKRKPGDRTSIQDDESFVQTHKHRF